jgi:hypothetical protein
MYQELLHEGMWGHQVSGGIAVAHLRSAPVRWLSSNGEGCLWGQGLLLLEKQLLRCHLLPQQKALLEQLVSAKKKIKSQCPRKFFI